MISSKNHLFGKTRNITVDTSISLNFSKQNMNGRIPDNGIAGENGIRPYCIVTSGTAWHNDKSPPHTINNHT